MAYAQTIAQFVKDFRKATGYSQNELGRRLGFTGQYISNVERGMNLRPVLFCKKLMTLIDRSKQNHLDELLRDAVYQSVEHKLQPKRKRNGYENRANK